MYKWLAGLLIVYSLFSLGIVYEVTGMNDVNRIEVPYSLALSGERIGIVIHATQDDVVCVDWLKDRCRESNVVVDYNGWLFARSYFPIGYRFYLWGDKWPDKVLVFSTTWNERTGKYVMAESAGLRRVVDIDYGGLIKVFQSGNATVWHRPEVK